MYIRRNQQDACCFYIGCFPLQDFEAEPNTSVVARLRPIMLKNLPIMLLSIAQKIAHYAQNYAHKIQLCSCSIMLISVCYSTS